MSRTADSPAISRAWVADKVFMGQSAGEYIRSLVTPFMQVCVLCHLQ